MKPVLHLLFCPLPSPQQAARLFSHIAPLLSPIDKAHILRFTVPEAAAARITARALLVLATSSCCPVLPATLHKTAAGAPLLRDTSPLRASVSFSYSPQAAVCALAFSPAAEQLGVDLEALASPPPDYRAFQPEERPHNSQDALRRWTIKEALSKAWGTGLHLDPALLPTGKRAQRRGIQPGLHTYSPLLWQTLPLPGHWCSIALSRTLPLRVSCLTPAVVGRTMQQLRI